MNSTSNEQTNGRGYGRGKARSVVVVPSKDTEIPDIIKIIGIETKSFPVTIVGQSQLIVNNFGWKAAQQLETDRARTAEEKTLDKKKGKPAITPEEIERRWMNARILDNKGRDCILAAWIKAALVTASKSSDIGIASTRLRGAIYVDGDLLPIQYTPRPVSASNETVTYFGSGPGRRRDIVRVGPKGRKQPDVRYRPCFDDWSIDFTVTFEPKLVSVATVYQLIRRAGMSVGLCEWRPEGPGGGSGGQYGRFDLDLQKIDVEAITRLGT